MAVNYDESLEKRPRRTSSDNEDDDDEGSPIRTENKFANDGSFFELFKKKMAEQQINTPPEDPPEIKPAHTKIETEDGETQLKAYQAGIGRRKTLLKTLKLREKRKRHREELEELKKAEDVGSQSEAWKTYMKEVKELQEKCCSDKEGHKRPLVK